MAYQHGIYVKENPTSIVPPIKSESAIQFIVGTAPVNLIEEPSSAVNKPILINSFDEAVSKVGYSDSFDKFTLCQSIDASFRIFNVAPIVILNVLDPDVHFTALVDQVKSVANAKLLIGEEGILLDDNFIVKSADGLTTYTKDVDYKVSFDSKGYVLVEIIDGGTIETTIEQLSLDYNQLDPTAVTEADIIGGYDELTGKYTGLENIIQVFPRLGVVIGQIVVPGWSHKPNVGAAMTAKTININGSFKSMAIKDVDTTEVTVYKDAHTWKITNNYTDVHDMVLWPMVKVGTKKYYMSALFAALIANIDYINEGVPYVSPSNKDFRITETILDDGTEVFLDQVQGNYLNGQGIVTAINLNGWRSWGNNTGAYPETTGIPADPKDRFISVRRMFDWWGNTFIVNYLNKVDDPMNKRLIESLVDSENIRANGYKARFQLADAKMEFRISDNPESNLLNGIIMLRQYITPYPPAETIINTLEFDSSALSAALT